MERTDKYSGKPVPATAQVGNSQEGTCEHCGGHDIISACPRCGAPVCCKDCCEKDWRKTKASPGTRNVGGLHEKDSNTFV